MSRSAISVVGYDLLGSQGSDGIRYAWQYQHGEAFIESAAFPQHSVGQMDGICGYTSSVSAGCILRSSHEQCVFCRTGNILPFSGLLSYKDIAKQNIFMVLADMNCKDHPELHDRPREFAYMGQGEPGFSYQQVRLAIELTNRAMRELGQSVHRHIFATSGVPDAITALKEDILNYYTQRVTLHFSLHASNQREKLMPIEKRWSFKEVLHAMDDFYSVAGEKPCIGLMLFHQFSPRNNAGFSYSNDLKNIESILSHLDPRKYRLSFCTYNSSDDICTSEIYPPELAASILEYAQKLGFEAKLFSSFGKEKQTACGMLGGKEPERTASEKWIEIEKQVDQLITQLV